jgi:hypothetical protein
MPDPHRHANRTGAENSINSDGINASILTVCDAAAVGAARVYSEG